MTDTYSVLARDALSFDATAAARAIAKATGQVLFDVRRQLRQQVGILATGLEQGPAEQLAGALSVAGVAAFALAESAFVRFPEPALLETARLAEDALDIADLRDTDNRPIGALKVPYANIVLLVTAHVRTETQKRVVEGGAVGVVGGEHPYGLLGALGDASRRRTRLPRPEDLIPKVRHEIQVDYDHHLDIYTVEPAHHLRLPASTFNFHQTGLEVKPTSITNLTEFVTHFVPHCTQAFVDPSILHILDGNPQTNLKFNSPDEYDAYLDWRVQVLYHPEQ
jgi:hypothetical protein